MPSTQRTSKDKFPRKLVKGKRGGFRGRKLNVKHWKVIVYATLSKADYEFAREIGAKTNVTNGKVRKNASEGIRRALEYYRDHVPGAAPRAESNAPVP